MLLRGEDEQLLAHFALDPVTITDRDRGSRTLAVVPAIGCHVGEAGRLAGQVAGVGAVVGADAAPGTKLLERRGRWKADAYVANLAGPREADVRETFIYVVSLGALVRTDGVV